MRALAVLCVRNEAVHTRRCLRDLVSAGLDVVLIDNDSTDDTLATAEEFRGRGLVALHRLPWTGTFSLTDQLNLKQSIIEAVDHDWIVHVDADEWLCSPIAGQSLLAGIAGADEAGYTCINFHEFVFVPMPGEDFCAGDYADRMLTYYFFQPVYPRLNRAWKRKAGLNNAASGGHRLAGESLRMFPQDFHLRHYTAPYSGIRSSPSQQSGIARP